MQNLFGPQMRVKGAGKRGFSEMAYFQISSKDLLPPFV
jgi:hypothetical protein